jgi:hypothetical protein
MRIKLKELNYKRIKLMRINGKGVYQTRRLTSGGPRGNVHTVYVQYIVYFVHYTLWVLIYFDNILYRGCLQYQPNLEWKPGKSPSSATVSADPAYLSHRAQLHKRLIAPN